MDRSPCSRSARAAFSPSGGKGDQMHWWKMLRAELLVAEPQAKPPGSQAVAPKRVLSAMSCLRNCVSARRARGWPLAGPDDPIRRRRPEALPLAIEVAPWLTRAPGPWTTSGRIQRARLGATRGPGARPAAEVRISGSRRRSRAASDRGGRRLGPRPRRRADRRSRTSSCCVS